MQDNINYNLTLFTGVLNEDNVTVLNDGYYYTGHNKSSVKLEYFTYANEWSDRKNVKFFQNLDNALTWYARKFKDRVVFQGAAWLCEDDDSYIRLSDLLRQEFSTLIENINQEEKDAAINKWLNVCFYSI